MIQYQGARVGFVGGEVALVQRFLRILKVFLSVIIPPTVHSHQSPSVTMIGLPATTLSQLCSLIRASPFTPRCPVFYVGSTEFNLVYVGVGNETCRCVSCRTSVNRSGWKAGRRSLRAVSTRQNTVMAGTTLLFLTEFCAVLSS